MRPRNNFWINILSCSSDGCFSSMHTFDTVTWTLFLWNKTPAQWVVTLFIETPRLGWSIIFDQVILQQQHALTFVFHLNSYMIVVTCMPSVVLDFLFIPNSRFPIITLFQLVTKLQLSETCLYSPNFNSPHSAVQPWKSLFYCTSPHSIGSVE